MHVERCELPEKDFKRVEGQLHRHENGFGFIENAFVSPQLIDSVDPSIQEVGALAVHAKNLSKGVYGWRVIQLNAL